MVDVILVRWISADVRVVKRRRGRRRRVVRGGRRVVILVVSGGEIDDGLFRDGQRGLICSQGLNNVG